MKLNNALLKDENFRKEKGYALPKYDREAMIKNTRENPSWIHFGAGNIFRAFLAKASQQLLDEGLTDCGIIAAEGRGNELAEKVFRPYDRLTLLVEFAEGGNIKKSVIGSIAEICCAVGDEGGFDRMKEIFRAPSLQLASFTVTEKGYKLTDSAGNIFPDAERDFSAGAEYPESFMGKAASLLYERYSAGGAPIAMVSMDNCSDNGDILKGAMLAFAEKWEEKGLVKKGFSDYIKSDKVSFPITMIDKITPRPDASIEKELISDGLEDIGCITTSKSTYAAAYVNAEETGYLVIEDIFPNGRPPFEKCGFYMTDRETVRLTEKMKVSACLNPLHTALAVFGCLLGFDRICNEVKDNDLLTLVKRIGYDEGLPVVAQQNMIDPKAFIDEVINVRLPNPHLPDTPQRIACDTSMKLSVRFGETVKQYIEREDKDAYSLRYIPLVYAGWLRYLMAVDDKGNAYELSSDPFLGDSRAEYMRSLKIGGEFSEDIIRSILSDEGIFGVDISSTSLYGKVLAYFKKMAAREGAVRETLAEALE